MNMQLTYTNQEATYLQRISVHYQPTVFFHYNPHLTQHIYHQLTTPLIHSQMAVHLMSFHGSIVGVLCMLDSRSLCMSTGYTMHKLYFCYIYAGPGTAFLQITYMYQVHYNLDMSYIHKRVFGILYSSQTLNFNMNLHTWWILCCWWRSSTIAKCVMTIVGACLFLIQKESYYISGYACKVLGLSIAIQTVILA